MSLYKRLLTIGLLLTATLFMILYIEDCTLTDLFTTERFATHSEKNAALSQWAQNNPRSPNTHITSDYEQFKRDLTRDGEPQSNIIEFLDLRK